MIDKRTRDEIDNAACRHLACAILERAVRDYRGSDLTQRKDAARFFYSPWCKRLWEGVMDTPVEVLRKSL